MRTTNEPVTIYTTDAAPTPVIEWSQDEVNAFHAGWESLDDETRKFSIAQPELLRKTPHGILNVRNNEYVETFEKQEPKLEPKAEEIAKRTEDRLKGSQRADDATPKRGIR